MIAKTTTKPTKQTRPIQLRLIFHTRILKKQSISISLTIITNLSIKLTKPSGKERTKPLNTTPSRETGKNKLQLQGKQVQKDLLWTAFSERLIEY